MLCSNLTKNCYLKSLASNSHCMKDFRKPNYLAAMKKNRALLSSLSSPPTATRQFSKSGLKVIVLVCLVLFLLAFLRLHFRTTLRYLISSYNQTSAHVPSSDDVAFEGTPKIAFLFLARKNLPLDFLWGTFFENVDRAMFSIYVHSEPGFVLEESNTKSAFFYDRQLNDSIQVAWGEPTMIDAERLLFEAALADPANQRFVLLSDSCIPLYNFSYVYRYLMSSPKSFVDSFIDVKEDRYNPKMSSVVPKEKWRKGSQWIVLIRRHALIVVDDDIVFPVFRKFCKRWPPADQVIKRRQMLQSTELVQIGHNCIPDEHYIQTLLKMNGLNKELERRTLTYTSWNDHSGEGGEKGSWHPFQFKYLDATSQAIRDIKAIDHVSHDNEEQKELCHVNVTTAPCFLFARKFTPLAGFRLLTDHSIDL